MLERAHERARAIFCGVCARTFTAHALEKAFGIEQHRDAEAAKRTRVTALHCSSGGSSIAIAKTQAHTRAANDGHIGLA